MSTGTAPALQQLENPPRAIGRRSEAWVIEGGCSIGAGSIRQEKHWPMFERETRLEAIEHLNSEARSFIADAREVIDNVGEQHVDQILTALKHLTRAGRKAEAAAAALRGPSIA